ncbi:Protein NSG2 [Kluyveromyces marxianus]|uniref:Protein NSG2 n=2 Tax=Kluyveromyces marxianus TaxID=4911 RepID=W0TBJ3_KLUMD|nr:protein NSG2 [Kluyveromyces marxianus DMKU3-1042]QGN16111.1 protein NSG2 [Kluyveromyces marxianus]BAO40378.1 protein NSG2 [Kluyveromyces marxianus DMKU3-1042]BAP71867.1 protein NSG2 [Kluyveromyces marxianus]
MEEKPLKSTGSKFGSSDSFHTLTKPTLFGLYDDDVVKSEDTEIYEEVKKTSNEKGSVAGKEEERLKSLPSVSTVATTWIVLSAAGIAYHELSKNLHDNHELHNDFTSHPLLLAATIAQSLSFGYIPPWVAYAIEGIVFGSIVPILDWLFGIFDTNSISISSVLRSTNAMLGVSFGIRRIEWSSSLQASGAWFLLNIVLWLFFDGTFTMLISGIAIGLITCLTCYHHITDNAQLLYFVDFYFLGLLFFTRLGKYMYRRR